MSGGQVWERAPFDGISSRTIRWRQMARGMVRREPAVCAEAVRALKRIGKH